MHHRYTAHLIGPTGTGHRLDILAIDMAHARQLARTEGAAMFGSRGFTYVVRAA